MTTRDWQPIDTAPDRVLVETKVHNERGEHNVQPLIKRGRLWFVEDGSMYVYYDPTHWRPLK